MLTKTRSEGGGQQNNAESGKKELGGRVKGVFVQEKLSKGEGLEEGMERWEIPLPDPMGKKSCRICKGNLREGRSGSPESPQQNFY